VELEGLDIPEMGALAYPDFVLGPGTPLGAEPVAASKSSVPQAAFKPAHG